MKQKKYKVMPFGILKGFQYVFLLFVIFTLSSCRDKIEKFEIERLSSLSFTTDGLSIQYADKTQFYKGKVALHLYNDGSSELLNRYLLEAIGKTPEGKNMIIDIEFDIYTDTSYVGIYTPVYQPQYGGIYSFSYLKETSSGVWESYNLDKSDLSSTFFRIKRQNVNEKLILGDFLAKLQSDKDSSVKIVLFDGVFKDISYSFDEL
jgi:hypothetical protein